MGRWRSFSTVTLVLVLAFSALAGTPGTPRFRTSAGSLEAPEVRHVADQRPVSIGWARPQVVFTGVQSPGRQRLRVLSYNIHHGEGVDGKLDLARIASVIRSVEPDIVALQEVDQKVARTQGVDQPEELARLTKMQVVFGGNIALQGGAYGNAVLSRLPILRHANHKLPCLDNGEQRGVLELQVELPGNSQPLRVLATHLDHRRSDQERMASAKMIHELTVKQTDLPALLIGDLNDTPESNVLSEFGKLWIRANEKPLSTIPVTKPTRQIDFILFRPKDRWIVTETKVLDEAIASDHRPILAVFELLPRPPNEG